MRPQGTVGPINSSAAGRSFFIFKPYVVLSIFTLLCLPSSSVSPMHECLEKYSCMSLTFRIVVLNGTCLFDEMKCLLQGRSFACLYTILYCVPPRVQWMDYRWLSLLGNLSTGSGSSDSKGTVGPSYDYSVGTFFFHACCTLYHIHCPLLILFLCNFVVFQCCSSRTQVFGRTRVHKFHIFYSNTEWSLLWPNRKL